jgi:hypothetical protein
MPPGCLTKLPRMDEAESTHKTRPDPVACATHPPHQREGISLTPLGAVFNLIRGSAYALRVSGKPSLSGVDLGGIPQLLRDRAASASVALAEDGFPFAIHRVVYQTRPGTRNPNSTIPCLLPAA